MVVTCSIYEADISTPIDIAATKMTLNSGGFVAVGVDEKTNAELKSLAERKRLRLTMSPSIRLIVGKVAGITIGNSTSIRPFATKLDFTVKEFSHQQYGLFVDARRISGIGKEATDIWRIRDSQLISAGTTVAFVGSFTENGSLKRVLVVTTLNAAETTPARF